jgi:hypothetical protein
MEGAEEKVALVLWGGDPFLFYPTFGCPYFHDNSLFVPATPFLSSPFPCSLASLLEMDALDFFLA